MKVTRRKNQDKLVEEMDDRLAQIQDQLTKLMEGMTSMNDRNLQTEKNCMRLRKPLADWELRENKRNSEEQNLQRIGHVQLNQSMKSDTRKFTTILVDQFFAMDEVAFDQRVRVASIHLEGEAIA
ncbi:hypothetical protein KY284_020397 [Solanum tuberosum]|nr:hypothetical protein KY284_020397 [Solanum tuberosum]